MFPRVFSGNQLTVYPILHYKKCCNGICHDYHYRDDAASATSTLVIVRALECTVDLIRLSSAEVR